MLGKSKLDKFEVSPSVVHMGTNQWLFENTECCLFTLNTNHLFNYPHI